MNYNIFVRVAIVVKSALCFCVCFCVPVCFCLSDFSFPWAALPETNDLIWFVGKRAGLIPPRDSEPGLLCRNNVKQTFWYKLQRTLITVLWLFSAGKCLTWAVARARRSDTVVGPRRRHCDQEDGCSNGWENHRDRRSDRPVVYAERPDFCLRVASPRQMRS